MSIVLTVGFVLLVGSAICLWAETRPHTPFVADDEAGE